MPVEWAGGGGGGGGGGGSVGGIEATVSLDTSAVDPGLAALRAGLDRAGAAISQLEAKAVASTRWTDRWMAGLGGVGDAATKSSYQMRIFAQGLDDLRYVPQMGLTPILNNLVQISPQLGIVAIAAQGLVTAMGGLEGISKTLFGESKTLTEAERMDTLAKNTHKSAEATAYLNAQKKEQAAIEAMLGGKSKAARAVEAGVQGALDESNAEAIVQGVMAQRAAEGTPLETDKHLPGAIARTLERFKTARRVAAGGGTDEEMIGFGAKGPAAEAQRLQGELNDLARKLVAARRKDAEKEVLEAKTDPSALLAKVGRRPDLFPAGTRSNLLDVTNGPFEGLEMEALLEQRLLKTFQKPLERAFGQGEATAREEENQRERLKKADTDLAARGQRVDAKDDAKRKENEAAWAQLDAQIQQGDRLRERGRDLNDRLKDLIDPARQGQSMGLDAYESSIKSQTGESPEAKRLHDIHEVLKDIRKNNERMKVLRIAKRGG